MYDKKLLEKNIKEDSSNNLLLETGEIFKGKGYDISFSETYKDYLQNEKLREIDLIASKDVSRPGDQHTRFNFIIECKYIPTDVVWLFWEDDNYDIEARKEIMKGYFSFPEGFANNQIAPTTLHGVLVASSKSVFFSKDTINVRLCEQRIFENKKKGEEKYKVQSDYSIRNGMAKAVEQVLSAHNSLRESPGIGTRIRGIKIPMIVVGGNKPLLVSGSGNSLNTEEEDILLWNFRFVDNYNRSVDYPIVIVHKEFLSNFLDEVNLNDLKCIYMSR